MPFEWVVALRFLREGRFQTWLIIGGATVGVAVVIFITALVNGLQANTIRRTLGTQAHIVVRPLEEVATAQRQPEAGAAVLPIGTRSWRPWTDSGQLVPMRHSAHARIMVKFRDFPTLAGFADHWGGRPGVTLGHIEWTLTETRQKETERSVLAQAVEVARERAQVLATAAGAGEGAGLVARCTPGGRTSRNVKLYPYGPDAGLFAVSSTGVAAPSNTVGCADLVSETTDWAVAEPASTSTMASASVISRRVAKSI